MRRLFVSIIILMAFGLKSQAQTSNVSNDYSKYEDKYSVYLKFTDNSFPQNNGDIDTYKIALEEYAKTHPPLPKQTLSGNTSNDDADYQIKIDEWFTNNPYFPRFIPYSNYHKYRTLQDDIQSYEAAAKLWMKKNKN